ncbi:MAG TPA: hypothetical protein P5081_14590 [Phycisphaerae bacterium]|nr:hypothetical protein [Phycisphaerae bacterium]HRW54098.1 hypothetical protein [Phycisphaerae bacterium]
MMKRFTLSLALLALTLAGSGCLAVSATDQSRGVKQTHQVVAVGNKVYLVNIRTGEASEIDVTKAKPLNTTCEHNDVNAGDQ